MRSLRFPVSGTTLILLVVVLTMAAGAATSDDSAGLKRRTTLPKSNLAVQRLVFDPATGNPQLVRLAGDQPTPEVASAKTRALQLLTLHAPAFGLTDPARELEPIQTRRDPLGGEQAIFRQVYHGIPVFGTTLRVHFNADDAVSTINGTIVSDINLDPVPRLDALEIETAATRIVAKQSGRGVQDLEASPAVLMVYREGLVRGRPGVNHLAWEVEVASPPNLHEVLYLDAHDGRLLDQRSKIHNLDRVIHRNTFPRPIWSEGDPIPYSSGEVDGDAEINELIDATGDTYDLFASMTNNLYLSFDGLDATMHSVYDSDFIDCPNAVESGGMTSFCIGMVSDDVAAHEWAHAYTEWTHGLIYQWQPGALNEAYSDIFGELVDQLNGRGTDTPGDSRPAGDCSNAGGSPSPIFEVTTPPSASGTYPAGGAVFNPLAPWTVSAAVELVDDGVGAPNDACEPLGQFTPGSIALIDRGTCFFRDKVLNAQNVGATGVIVINNQGNDVIEMGGELPRLDIPAVFIGQSDGARIKSGLNEGVRATLILDGVTTDSVRWIVGEDTQALGAIRDMWSPICFGDPGRVGSVNYTCSEIDNGGVHTNSGVPNHAFALLVDGGSYNGRQVRAIGSTKAARIYWRAMSNYQTPVTGFPGHADLLEASCQDLIGAQLYDLQTGSPVAETISTGDCAEVTAAMDAVEMRANPDQCGFLPLLDPDAPTVPSNLVVFNESFDGDPGDRWELSNRGIFPEYEPRDWMWTDDLPSGGESGAFFALDSVLIGDCRAGSDDQSGVMELMSPAIEIPRGSLGPILTFDHWVATEPEWDGGNVKISVNGGSFSQIPHGFFIHNPYNDRIQSGNTNPLAGQPAFTGTDQGSLDGSWGQTQIDLHLLAAAGDRIVLRFDFGVDGCNGAHGWYVDNVRVVTTALSPRQVGGRVRP